MFWRRKREPEKPKALIVRYPSTYPDEFAVCEVRVFAGRLFYSPYDGSSDWRAVRRPFHPVNFAVEDLPLSDEGRAALEKPRG